MIGWFGLGSLGGFNIMQAFKINHILQILALVILALLPQTSHADKLYLGTNIFDTFTGAVTASPVPQGFQCADPFGNFYELAENGTNWCIEKYDSSGNSTLFAPLPYSADTGYVFQSSGINCYIFMTSDSAGNIYMCGTAPTSQHGFFLEKFSPSGVGSFLWPLDSNPGGVISCDPFGNVYTYAYGNNGNYGVVYKYTNNQVLQLTTTQIPDAYGFDGYTSTQAVCDTNGNVYCLSGYYGIYKVSPSGAVTPFSSKYFYSTYHMTNFINGITNIYIGYFTGSLGIDSQGNIYAVVTNGPFLQPSLAQLVKFDPNGNSTVLATQDSSKPSSPGLGQFMAIIPSPPPAQAPLSLPKVQGTNFSWSASIVPCHTYQAQFSSCLTDTNWPNLGGPFVATNSTMMFSDTITNTVRFYRIKLIQ
jgi:hypothetical protein